MSPLTPELELLCRLLPVHFRGELPLPESWGGANPEALYRLILKTSLAPHAFRQWMELPALWERTPFETRAKVFGSLEIHRARQECLFKAWGELLEQFGRAGLAVIPVKGFVRSQFLYGEPFRRASCDFDLLVRRAGLDRAHGFLESHGFSCVKWEGRRLAAESSWTRPEAEGSPAVMVDLHWDVNPGWHFLAAPIEPAWDRAIRTETAGVSHLRLAAGDMLWFDLVNNVSDYGLGNLRGCVEALEGLACLGEADAPVFRERLAASRAYRLLRALESFRRGFFPGTPPGLVTRWQTPPGQPPGRAFESLFGQEALYLAGVKAPLGQRARIRLALAGSPWRFLRFGLGKFAWHALAGARRKRSPFSRRRPEPYGHNRTNPGAAASQPKI